MADPLVGTKLQVPRLHHRVVARPRLADVVRGTAPPGSLTLVSAPAGFGKTTLLADVVGTRDDDAPRAVAWVSLDARDADARRFWSYALQALESARPGLGGERAGAAGRARGAARGRPHAGDQRAERPPGRRHTRPRRLPPGRRAGGRGRHGLPPRPPAVLAAARPQHPRRPGPPPLPAARPRPARRGPRERPALLRRGGRRLPQRRPGPRARRGRRRRAGDPHRGLDRRPAARGAVPARPAGPDGLHRRVRRGRPVRRGLPRRRGARPATAAAAPLPARHLRPRAADRDAVRRRHVAARRGRGAGVPRTPQPAPRPPGQPAPLVPLPPPVRRRPAVPPAARAAGGRERTPPPGERVVPAGTATSRQRCGTPSQPTKPDRAADLIELAAPALRRERQEDVVRRWIRRTCRRPWSGDDPCSPRPSSAPSWPATSSTASSSGSATSRTCCRDRRTGWSCSTGWSGPASPP